MNNMTIENPTAVAENAMGNSQTATETAAPTPKSKGPIGRPRTNLTKEVVFLLLADGSYKRRGKGKPAHDSKAFVYRVPWDYKGDTLPEDSAFVRNEVIKDIRPD